MSERSLPVGGTAPPRLPPTPDRGATLLEVLLVVALVVLVVSLATPLTGAAVEAERIRQAATFISARFQHARQRAVAASASVGVVFDTTGGRSVFRVCVDGNGNGLRRAEIDAGQDSCPEGPYDLGVLFPGVRIAVDAALRGPDGEPGSADAVRFGRSEMASFSPAGTCSSGSLFLKSATGAQYVVRVAGVTARTRVLRYDTATGHWSEP
jgi:hypothetical protein